MPFHFTYLLSLHAVSGRRRIEEVLFQIQGYVILPFFIASYENFINCSLLILIQKIIYIGATDVFAHT